MKIHIMWPFLKPNLPTSFGFLTFQSIQIDYTCTCLSNRLFLVCNNTSELCKWCKCFSMVTIVSSKMCRMFFWFQKIPLLGQYDDYYWSYSHLKHQCQTVCLTQSSVGTYGLNIQHSDLCEHKNRLLFLTESINKHRDPNKGRLCLFYYEWTS